MSYECFSDEEFKTFINKKDFSIYKNNIVHVKKFKRVDSYKQFLLALIEFTNGDNECPFIESEEANVTFEIVKEGIIEKTKAYHTTCLKNKENALKSVEKRQRKKEIKDVIKSMGISASDVERKDIEYYKEQKGITSFMLDNKQDNT